jgi:hypothetical protein
LIGSKYLAVELLALALSHQATDQQARDRARQLLAALEAELPASMLAAAQARGQASELEKVAAELLAEEKPFDTPLVCRMSPSRTLDRTV